jgi:hypothetical protein
MTARQDQHAAQLVAGHVIPTDSPNSDASGHSQAQAPRAAADATTVRHEAIAAEAYALWIARGQQKGSDVDDWLEAERRLRAAAGMNGDAERVR